jgi:hypothetical protein
MQVRVYGFGTKNRLATIALIAAALAIGAVLVAFGLVLLLGLATAGLVVGSGLMIYHRLTGRGPMIQRWRPREELDPALQVFPDEVSSGDRPNADRLIPPDDKP